MGLQEKWIQGIYSIATDSPGRRRRLAPLAGAGYFLFMGLCIPAALVVDGWLRLPGIPR